jgi:hypothetical protein
MKVMALGSLLLLCVTAEKDAFGWRFFWVVSVNPRAVSVVFGRS